MTRRSPLFSFFALVAAAGCATSIASDPSAPPDEYAGEEIRARAMASVPSPDPRVGLSAGLMDAGEAIY